MAPHQPKKVSKSDSLRGTAKLGVKKQASPRRKYPKVRRLPNGLLDVQRKTGKYVNSSQQNQQQSRLLQVPSEIRQQIYGYILGGKTLVMKRPATDKVATRRYGSATKHTIHNFAAILAVCRQLYAEAATQINSITHIRINLSLLRNFASPDDLIWKLRILLQNCPNLCQIRLHGQCYSGHFSCLAGMIYESAIQALKTRLNLRFINGKPYLMKIDRKSVELDWAQKPSC